MDGTPSRKIVCMHLHKHQPAIERTLFMKIPTGVEPDDGANVNDYVLKIHRNVYDQQQAGRVVWNNKYLVTKPVKVLGFKQSREDECVFYRGNVFYVCTRTIV